MSKRPQCFGFFNEKSTFCQKVCKHSEDCIKKKTGELVERPDELVENEVDDMVYQQSEKENFDKPEYN